MTVTSLTFNVTTAASVNDACDVGIYDAVGARLVSSGSTLGKLNAATNPSVTVAATQLRAGVVYYAALACGAIGGTAAQSAGPSYYGYLANQLFGATLGTMELAEMAAAFPLPATFTAANSFTGFFLAVRE